MRACRRTVSCGLENRYRLGSDCDAPLRLDALNTFHPARRAGAGRLYCLDSAGGDSSGALAQKVCPHRPGDDSTGSSKRERSDREHEERHDDLDERVPSSWRFAHAPTLAQRAPLDIIALLHAEPNRSCAGHSDLGCLYFWSNSWWENKNGASFDAPSLSGQGV
jgi:hypothetical protein